MRKKIIIVIVEGVSDQTALEMLLSRIFTEHNLYVHIVHGDITSESNNTSSNIVSKIGDILKSYAASNHFTNTDFYKVIHLIDMDGTFISEENMVCDKEAKGFVYSDTEIRSNNIERLKVRNANKSTNIVKLISTNQIWGIPYKAYYMSCDLDHVLYNKRNSTDKDKKRDSIQFAKLYKNKEEEFIRFICSSYFSVMTGYKESWTYIKQELHSLERHTNLGLCFNQETGDTK